ncbi:hypothetical protein LX77_01473 [Gelidibacter algens]|uniref:Uncharacterized protein n=1 Tax=Gelidibacter algens TaxID=49280 RepID=A0A1A7R1G2_9FLAO|nr:hypothetical protein [Gelidibacter algens]OBX25358.1 hypothetical protein A9996_10455 [Gelidibacter algens]RAJ25172.1 hypothetical protein LX77_01473 [Gelidibacter algens]
MTDKTDKRKNKEFDPEKNKEVENGPLKSKHVNQYGEKHDKKDRNMSKRVDGEEDKEDNT